MIHQRRFASILAVLFALGCGETPTGPEVHPVKGRITVGGEPAVGAEVVFHADAPIPGVPSPTAIVDAGGDFALGTRTEGDGAPAGEYRVTVVWRGGASRLADDDGGGADRLLGRYSDPAAAGLRATVKPGENLLAPIELKAARSRR